MAPTGISRFSLKTDFSPVFFPWKIFFVKIIFSENVARALSYESLVIGIGRAVFENRPSQVGRISGNLLKSCIYPWIPYTLIQQYNKLFLSKQRYHQYSCPNKDIEWCIFVHRFSYGHIYCSTATYGIVKVYSIFYDDFFWKYFLEWFLWKRISSFAKTSNWYISLPEVGLTESGKK